MCASLTCKFPLRQEKREKRNGQGETHDSSEILIRGAKREKRVRRPDPKKRKGGKKKRIGALSLKANGEKVKERGRRMWEAKSPSA